MLKTLPNVIKHYETLPSVTVSCVTVVNFHKKILIYGNADYAGKRYVTVGHGDAVTIMGKIFTSDTI